MHITIKYIIPAPPHGNYCPNPHHVHLVLFITKQIVNNYIFHVEGIVDINHLLLTALLFFAVGLSLHVLTPKNLPHSGLVVEEPDCLPDPSNHPVP